MSKKTDETIETIRKHLDNINKSLIISEDCLKTLENDVEEIEKEQDDIIEKADKTKEKMEEPLTLLAEIIEKAENWDFGLKGWRTLETKQDLIDAIKKEVLNV